MTRSSPCPWLCGARAAAAFCLGLALIASGVIAASAQEHEAPGTARRALEAVSRQFGSAFVARIVELRGEAGQSQPPEWWMTTHDPASPTTLGLFWFGDGEASREGSDEDVYPHHPPRGFFSAADVRLDSTDAFRRADEAANAAGIGFDTLDYVLRAREFSTEPVWEVTLRNRGGRIVGWTVHSAVDGRLLRTVWYRRGRQWEPTVEDSALAFDRESTTEAGGAEADPAPTSAQQFSPAPPSGVSTPFPAGTSSGTLDPGNEAGEIVPIEPCTENR